MTTPRISPSGPDLVASDLDIAQLIRFDNVQNVIDPLPLDITLEDDTTFLSIVTSGTGQIRTITGSARGRLLLVMIFNFGTKTIVHNSNPGTSRSIICPGLVNFDVQVRDCFWLLGLGTDGWEVVSAPLGLGRVRPPQLGLIANSQGTAFRIINTFVPGASQDVVIYNANNPVGFTITDVSFITTTAVVGSTVQLRNATGGGGSALSSALSSAATPATSRNNVGALSTLAANGSLVVRRSDIGVGGTIIIDCVAS